MADLIRTYDSPLASVIFQDSPKLARDHAGLRTFCTVAETFREFFTSPFQQYEEHIGKRFVVLGHDVEAENDCADAVGVDAVAEAMYKIRLEDGTEITAWGHEVLVLDLGNCT